MNTEFDEKKVREQYRKLTLDLIAKKMTIATMESITSGQIASLITDTEGASAIFKGGFVTYSNEAKISCGVAKEIIDRYSVYSKETAIEMARCCRDKFATDIGIGVTGTTGNIDPNNSAFSTPGKIYYAICFDGKDHVFEIDIQGIYTRLEYKLLVAQKICDSINEYCLE